MKKREDSKTTIDVISLAQKRIHLLKISVLPFLLMVIGSYLMSSTTNFLGVSESAMKKNTLGMFLVIIAIVWMIIAYLIDAKRTYKEWNITKKQRDLYKNQKYKKQNKFLFWVLAIFIVLYVYLRGAEGSYQIAKVIDAIIYLAVIWSIWIIVKNWLKNKRK